MNWLDCNVVQPALAAIQDATRTPPLSQLGNSGSGSKAIQVAATVAIEQALQLQAKSNADGAMTVHRTSQQKRTYDLLHPQVARLVDEHSAHQAVVYELLLAIVGSPVQMMKWHQVLLTHSESMVNAYRKISPSSDLITLTLLVT